MKDNLSSFYDFEILCDFSFDLDSEYIRINEKILEDLIDQYKEDIIDELESKDDILQAYVESWDKKDDSITYLFVIESYLSKKDIINLVDKVFQANEKQQVSEELYDGTSYEERHGLDPDEGPGEILGRMRNMKFTMFADYYIKHVEKTDEDGNVVNECINTSIKLEESVRTNINRALQQMIEFLVEFKDIYVFPENKFLADSWEDLLDGVNMGIDSDFECSEIMIQHFKKHYEFNKRHSSIAEDDPMEYEFNSLYERLVKEFEKEVARYEAEYAEEELNESSKNYNVQFYQIFEAPSNPTDNGKMIGQRSSLEDARSFGKERCGDGKYLIKAVCDDGKVRYVDNDFNESSEKKLVKDAGDVEHNVAMFNTMNNPSESPSTNPNGPMAEELEDDVKSDLKKCEKCNNLLADDGSCPLCDHGDEDLYEEEVDPDITKYADELEERFRNDSDNHVRYLYDELYTEDDEIVIIIHNGDWKHEHLYCDKIVQDFFARKGLIIQVQTEEIGESDSDCYSAEHRYSYYKKAPYMIEILKLMDMENENED